MKADRISFQLKNRLAEMDQMVKVLAEFGQVHELSADTMFALHLALEEILTNVISYAFDDGREHLIEVRLTHSEGCVSVEVEDDGHPFNPLELPEPDITEPLESRAIGGLGIFLVRKVMDEVQYCRLQDRNVIIMKKRVESAGA